MTRLQREMQRMADDNAQIEAKDAEIKRLIAQRDDLKRTLDASDDQHRTALAEVALLRAALKPFADCARAHPNRADNASVLVGMDDCRAALKALDPKTQEES